MNVYPKYTITAFTVQLAHELGSGTDRWEVGICELSCPPPYEGTLKTNLVVGEAHACVYCTLISPHFVRERKFSCIRIYIHTTAFCNHVFENVNHMPFDRRKFREIRLIIANTARNQIALKCSNTTAKFVLHFRPVFQSFAIYKHVTNTFIAHSKLCIHLYGTISIKKVEVVVITV